MTATTSVRSYRSYYELIEQIIRRYVRQRFFRLANDVLNSLVSDVMNSFHSSSYNYNPEYFEYQALVTDLVKSKYGYGFVTRGQEKIAYLLRVLAKSDSPQDAIQMIERKYQKDEYMPYYIEIIGDHGLENGRNMLRTML